MKRKQKDSLVASAIIRLDTNVIRRSPSAETFNVELVEYVDFHIEEELKRKAEAIYIQSKHISDNEKILNDFIDIKNKRDTFCCCCEYRGLRNRENYSKFKEFHYNDIKVFKNFIENYGPFEQRNHEIFKEIEDFGKNYETLKKDYDTKQITIQEIIGTMTFQLDILRSEDEYLRTKRKSIDCEIAQNSHENLFLKEKILHIHRLWGTLGILDSLNFFKNFSICTKTFIFGENENMLFESPLTNLPDLKTFQGITGFYSELFVWMPDIMLLLAILISFCRPDFLTLIVFIMIHPFTKYRWRLEHYYSTIFAIFIIIFFDICW